MKIDVLTLFPKMFDGFTSESIINKAINSKKININIHNLRDYSKNKHKKVDDTPYGGGSGMVLMCQPIFDGVSYLKKKNSKVIMLTPQGERYNQKIAYELRKEKHLIFVCGHYEGFDERILNIVDREISIGDYVLTGGELPAMVIIDSIARLVPGVIQEESHENDTFSDDLLDYPTYTKPRDYKGMKVPDVLVSGDHKKIENWRKEMKVKQTIKKRPDIYLKKVKLEKVGLKKRKNEIDLNDIKNIKVVKQKIKKTKVKEKSKRIKYVLLKENNMSNLNIKKINKLNGYKLKSKANNTLGINRIEILSPILAKHIARKNIEKRMKTLLYKFNEVYDDEDSESSRVVLGEAQKLRDMLTNNYFSYLDVDLRKTIIGKINIIIENLKKRLNIKVIDNTKTTRKNI